MEGKKFNPYLIIIVVLVLAVVVFAYDKWGNGFLPASVNTDNVNNNPSVVDTKVSDSDIVIGSVDAPVTIVEYFSYFCGYCKLFHDEIYPNIVEKYISTGKVKMVIRVFPPVELGASLLCAQEQDKFTEFHNLLYEKSNEIEKIEDIVVIAETLELNKDEFSQCLINEDKLKIAENWYNQGQKDFENAGVPEEQRGTPTFLVNGEIMIGAQPFESFVEVIERKLTE